MASNKIESVFLCLLLCLQVNAQAVSQEHKDRAAALVSQMTLQEKMSLLGGYRDGFYMAPVERLGIPEIRMADGPQGVRNNTKSTLFACGVAAAATWNPDLVYEMGRALGQDARARGVHILLGPGVNIARSPLCGRNFEYFGEDPFLAGEAAVSYVKGVQSEGVMATIKHFALNDKEENRLHSSSVADERTMHEIYFPAFRAAVERADVGSVMLAYNMVNFVHATENPYLIRETLRERWHFDGFTMSDWTATYSPVSVVENGVDLEMPRALTMKEEYLLPLLEKGVIREEQIDEKVRRILQTFIAFGFLDRPQLDSSISEDNPYSRDVAYRLAGESLVLLKNDGVLPLRKKAKLTLIGPKSDEIPCGGGSGAVEPIYSVSLHEGLGRVGAQEVSMTRADAVVVAVGFDKTTEKEHSDRSFFLPEGQESMIEAALSSGKPVIVVVYAGGAVDVSRWADKVSALVWAWYPGQEGGLALAEMLTGRFSPSGHLPVSFPEHIEDNPSQAWWNFEKPYTKRGLSVPFVTYGEGVFVGYRGYKDKTPRYPFGYGLSYTYFAYDDFSVVPAADGFDVSVTVCNTGSYDGAATLQLYVGEDVPCVPRPEKELKAFRKVFLRKGASQTVTMHLGREAFCFYDASVHDWRLNPGTYTLYLGESCEDIVKTSAIAVK